jgi:hypothetical protein
MANGNRFGRFLQKTQDENRFSLINKGKVYSDGKTFA